MAGPMTGHRNRSTLPGRRQLVVALAFAGIIGLGHVVFFGSIALGIANFIWYSLVFTAFFVVQNWWRTRRSQVEEAVE